MKPVHEAFHHFKASLEELYNVSSVRFRKEPGPQIPAASVYQAEAPKCDRCWRHVPDVGQEEKYPTVCHRCAEALDAIDFPPYAATNS
jgi:isoleucyl-tRNA synthetase